MIEYILYRCGFFLVSVLPLGFSYTIARIVATLQFFAAKDDRAAVVNNLKTITKQDKASFKLARKMYVNFGLYLADFFRFSKLNKQFVQKNVEICGRQYLDEALSRNKGVIVLTAHLGNWELGGVVAAILGYKIAGVALAHKDKRVDDFFNGQRNLHGLEVIPIGLAVRRCFKNLKENKIIALLGDRDFSQDTKGMAFKLFGKDTILPQGPAVLSLKTKAAIVPGFMLRDKGCKFKLIFEKPIYPEDAQVNDENIRALIGRYKIILEEYIARYPDQWFMFREFWK